MTGSVSWVVAVVALVAFAAGVLLSDALLPGGQKRAAAGLVPGASATAVPTSEPTAVATASPSATPRPALGNATTDVRLEATLPDSVNDTALTKWSITGKHARDTSALDQRLERIANLAGGVFWSYASATSRRDPSDPGILVEALVVAGTTTGHLLDAYVAYVGEAAPEAQCSYVSVLERRLAQCGSIVPDVWLGPHWVGTYAYVGGVTLYIIDGLGTIDDPWYLLFVQSIVGVLPK